MLFSWNRVFWSWKRMYNFVEKTVLARHAYNEFNLIYTIATFISSVERKPTSFSWFCSIPRSQVDLLCKFFVCAYVPLNKEKVCRVTKGQRLLAGVCTYCSVLWDRILFRVLLSHSMARYAKKVREGQCTLYEYKWSWTPYPSLSCMVLQHRQK